MVRLQAFFLPGPAGVAKRGKDRVRKRAVTNPHFGVPLHAQRELRCRLNRDGFNQAIGRFCLDAQSFTQPVDTLMVQRVDHHSCLSAQLRETPSRNDLDRVAVVVPALYRPFVVSLPVVKAPWLIMDGSLKAATERDIELLKTAADSEKWQASLKNQWEQLQRDRIARRINNRGHR